MQDGCYRGLVGYGRELDQRGSIAILGDCYMPRASADANLHFNVQPSVSKIRVNDFEEFWRLSRRRR